MDEKSTNSPLDVFLGTNGAFVVEISYAFDLAYEVMSLDAFRGDFGSAAIGHHPLQTRYGAIPRTHVLL